MASLEPEPPDGSGSTAASVLSTLDGMRALGIDVDAVCAVARLSIPELEAGEAMVPTARIAAMWREGERRLGRATIGIEVALAAPIGRIVVDYVAQTSATLRQGLEQVMRYYQLFTRNASVRFEPDGPRTVMALRPLIPADLMPPTIYEFSMGNVVRRVRAWTGREPLGVQFAHAPLGPRQDYERLLGVPLRFEAEYTGIVLDDALLAAPLRGHDPHLWSVVRAHADAQIARQSRDSSTRAQVRRALLPLIPRGEPEMQAVARALAVSERSLQRRLQEEGTTFREVVDDARKDLALGYLEDRRFAVADVAYLLGYSEAGAFVRAFKRWTGTTPSQVRS